MFLPSRKSYRESGGMMNGIQPAHLSSGSTFHKLRGSINSESLIVNLFFRVLLSSSNLLLGGVMKLDIHSDIDANKI
jgi:hypothetical protein